MKKRESQLTPSRSGVPLERMVGIIAQVLREHESPMAVKDLFDKVNEVAGGQIKIKNFRNNILPRALQRNKNIDRAMRGYYQYIRK